MNKFDEFFFKKYTPSTSKIKGIIHEHFIVIFDKIILQLSFFVFIPSFLYYNSQRLQDLIPFYMLEIFFILSFLKLIYSIFDWYNDVWIITDEGVIDLDWQLFKTENVSIRFENIEGVEVDQSGIMATLMKKGNLIIHKIGSDNFRLNNVYLPYEAIDEIERHAKGISDDEEIEERGTTEDMEAIISALTGVVKDYMEKKDEKKEEKKENIEKIRNMSGTIDLSDNND